ncbi:hypothetical protein ACFQ2B_06450 [Streptomyces stramineus]
MTERKDLSVVILQTWLGVESRDAGPEDVDVMLDEAARTIREKVESFGGTIAASIGSVSLALFEADHDREDGAERAVRAALAIRDHFHDPAGPGARTPSGMQGPVAQAAVNTGTALVRSHPGDTTPPSVVGALLDACHALLSRVPRVRCASATSPAGPRNRRSSTGGPRTPPRAGRRAARSGSSRATTWRRSSTATTNWRCCTACWSGRGTGRPRTW